MSDQVHKTLLACDGLNRTGQEAPANHEKSWKQRESLQVAASKIRVYTKGKETSGKECKKWEDGRNRCDNDIHMGERLCDAVGGNSTSAFNKKVECLIREADRLPDETLLRLICLVRSLSSQKVE